METEEIVRLDTLKAQDTKPRDNFGKYRPLIVAWVTKAVEDAASNEESAEEARQFLGDLGLDLLSALGYSNENVIAWLDSLPEVESSGQMPLFEVGNGD